MSEEERLKGRGQGLWGRGAGEQIRNQAVHVLSHPSGDAGKTAVLNARCSRERSGRDACQRKVGR